jgi:hypothetical protein
MFPKDFSCLERRRVNKQAQFFIIFSPSDQKSFLVTKSDGGGGEVVRRAWDKAKSLKCQVCGREDFEDDILTYLQTIFFRPAW